MIPPSPVEAFILAGGLSRRMGTPKALLDVNGRPMIRRVVDAVAPVASRVLLVTDRPAEVSFIGLPAIPDTYPEAGPLGGLHAALKAATSDAILLLSCDLPFLTSDLLRHLVLMHGERRATIPRSDRLHPVCAMYDRRLLDLAERRLGGGLRSMLDFVHEAGFLAVDVASLEPPVDPLALTNVNGPEDLAVARAFTR